MPHFVALDEALDLSMLFVVLQILIVCLLRMQQTDVMITHMMLV